MGGKPGVTAQPRRPFFPRPPPPTLRLSPHPPVRPLLRCFRRRPHHRHRLPLLHFCRRSGSAAPACALQVKRGPRRAVRSRKARGSFVLQRRVRARLQAPRRGSVAGCADQHVRSPEFLPILAAARPALATRAVPLRCERRRPTSVPSLTACTACTRSSPQQTAVHDQAISGKGPHPAPQGKRPPTGSNAATGQAVAAYTGSGGGRAAT